MIYLAVFTDLLITFVLFLSLFSIYRNRKQISEYKFRIYSRFTAVILIAIALTSVNLCTTIFDYFISGRISPLLNAYVNLVMIVLLSVFISCRGYICDIGIWSSGSLHRWNEIKSYNWADDGKYIVFHIKDKSIISEYKLKYRADKEHIEEINKYLSSRLADSKTTQDA